MLLRMPYKPRKIVPLKLSVRYRPICKYANRANPMSRKVQAMHYVQYGVPPKRRG